MATDSQRQGRVVRAGGSGSFAGLEKAARQVEAKGVFFDRGRHGKEKGERAGGGAKRARLGHTGWARRQG